MKVINASLFVLLTIIVAFGQDNSYHKGEQELTQSYADIIIKAHKKVITLEKESDSFNLQFTQNKAGT